MATDLEHLDMILNAPREISVSYTMSVLASKAINGIQEEFAKPKPEPEEKSPEIKAAEAEKAEAEAKKADAEADATDPTLDPNFQKEFYLTSFEYKGKTVVLKKVGMGASAPVSAYVDGKRKELFLTRKQAERETKKLIDMGVIDEATVDNIRKISLSGGIVEHMDGSISRLDFESATNILEIHDNLNNMHKEAFEKSLKDSYEAAKQMIDFFQSRLKRDVV